MGTSATFHLLTNCGMYILTSRESDLDEAEKQMQAAQAAFLHKSHLLEILSDRGNATEPTGFRHSLGGSLSLLANLMWLTKGEAPRTSFVLPVLTFGLLSIMCGGDCLLRELGLPQNHIRLITMHSDIVPRVFSCKYPSHIVEF
ncbi:hypothetical protein CDL12_21651 [Handroanthus impetiginosus]|uniref:Fungal lipase-type domain-containing protein n=1 Tax=Handroanthus impetiginosus TaxID=429701 RepID=A0A2G9GKR9_9LAMI|nr:hypothetical protein CDL12_21651 [Handroanthus impetiginosus]